MMNQETYVNVNDLHKQGWTIAEIAAETGWHRSTISKYLREGPPATRAGEPSVMTELWRTKIDTMLEAHPRLLSISVHNKLNADGFDGSYPTVVRAVRDNRGPRFKSANAVSVPIHTAPGDEAQFDFCDLSSWAVRFGWNIPLVAFGMILSWSRFRIWWFTTSEDRHHTFEGAARFFDETEVFRRRVEPIGWARSAGPRAGASSCTRRRSASPRTTARRSRRVRPATRNARARSSGRSDSSKRRSSPRLKPTARPSTWPI